jgi:hypothetical protein
MARIRGTLLALSVDRLLPHAECSCVLQSFELRPGRDYDALHG